MKIKEGFVLRQVVDNFVVVAVGNSVFDFSGMTTLNETGAFFWHELEKGATEEELVAALLKEYDVSEEVARRDTAMYVQKLKDAGYVED